MQQTIQYDSTTPQKSETRDLSCYWLARGKNHRTPDEPFDFLLKEFSQRTQEIRNRRRMRLKRLYQLPFLHDEEDDETKDEEEVSYRGIRKTGGKKKRSTLPNARRIADQIDLVFADDTDFSADVFSPPSSSSHDDLTSEDMTAEELSVDPVPFATTPSGPSSPPKENPFSAVDFFAPSSTEIQSTTPKDDSPHDILTESDMIAEELSVDPVTFATTSPALAGGGGDDREEDVIPVPEDLQAADMTVWTI